MILFTTFDIDILCDDMMEKLFDEYERSLLFDECETERFLETYIANSLEE